DMESHLAARIAAAHGLPFTACRVIVDPAHRNLPPAALLALRPDGSPDVPAVLRSVMEQPRQLPDLMRLAVAATIARAALPRIRAARRRTANRRSDPSGRAPRVGTGPDRRYPADPKASDDGAASRAQSRPLRRAGSADPRVHRARSRPG